MIRGDDLEKEIGKMEEYASQLRENLSENQRLVQNRKNSVNTMKEQVKLLESNNFSIKEKAIICEKMYKG